MRRIRTGVVGYGLGGRVFHAPFVSAVPTLELTAIVQRTGNSASDAYPQAALLRSVDELLASDVELVCITTPSNTHYTLSKQALLAGKHVVCDKPVTVTSAEAQDLEDTAKAQGVLMVPFQNRRWDGDFLTLKGLLETGRVGRTVTLDSRFDRYRPLAKEGAWRDDAEAGGGLLYDIGPHLIDQALALFGRPDRVWADVRRDRDEQGATADAFDLHLWFAGADGREITVRTGSTVLAVNPGPRYRLQGTLGSYVKFGLDPQEPAIVAGGHVPALGSPETWLNEPEAAWGTLTTVPDPAEPARVEQRLPTHRGDYREFYNNVAEAILGTTTQAVPARAAVHVARIIELALSSARTGQVLPVDAATW